MSRRWEGNRVLYGGKSACRFRCQRRRFQLIALLLVRSHLKSERKRGNVKQQKVRELLGLVLSTQNGSLDSGSEGDSLIGIDGLAGLLSVEELGEEVLDLGDTGGSSDEDNLVDGSLGELGITDDLLDGLHALPEVVHVQVLETGPGDGGVEVNSLEESIDLDVGLGGGGEGPLGALARGTEATEGTLVLGHVLAEPPLEVLEEVVDHPVVEILSSKVGVSSSGLDLEDSLLDGEEGDIEGSSSEIEDEDVLLLSLLVESVGDSGGGGLVDDTEDVKSGNGSSILSGLPLGVVEVSGDGDNGVLHLLSEVSLGNLSHLDEDHGGDLLSLELFGLSLVIDLDDGGSSWAGNNLERPVLHVGLDGRVGKLPSNETFGVEDGVEGVHGDLVLGSISNKTLSLVEGNVGRGGTVSLVVGDDLNAVVLPNANARVSGSEVDSDGFSGN